VLEAASDWRLKEVAKPICVACSLFAVAKSLQKTGHHPRIKSEGGLFRDHALLKTPRLTALRRAPGRCRLRIAEAAAEQPREEVAAVVLITALIVGYDPNENPLAGIGLQTARG
jgi:hypothetical protein